jgi:hypothetical protein
MKNMVYENKDYKVCACIGPKDCNDTNCKLVKEYREKQLKNCGKKAI